MVNREGQSSHLILVSVGQISLRNVGTLCVIAEVVVYSSCHLEPSVITEMQHVPPVLLAPMLPPMYFVLGLGDVAINVLVFDGVGAHPISVQGRVFGDILFFV